MNFKYTITVKDVYGTDTPAIPEGYELTGEFRPWRPGDYFLTSTGELEKVVFDRGPSHVPRLILRRKKVRKVIFTEIRRDSQPVRGEWYFSSTGRYEQWHTDYPREHSFGPTSIYRREEVEE